MRNRIQFPAWALAVLFLQGCSAKPNVEISVNPGVMSHMVSFDVLAMADEVIVKSVTINRGNCKIGSITEDVLKATVKLKFGQSFQGNGICTLSSVKEIKVSTNAGTFNFSFN